MRRQIVTSLLALSVFGLSTRAFTPLSTTTRRTHLMRSAEEEPKSSGGVVELGEEPNEEQAKEGMPKAVTGPLFISQGEIDPDTLNPDFSDSKQTRVVIYTILSLLPVLFLIPFMLGRDFIPADQLPPVEMMN